MNDDLGARIGGLIDAEGDAFARGHTADDLLLYRKAIRPRRLARRAAQATVAIVAVGAVGLGAWGVAARAPESPPTATTEQWPFSFEPYVHGYEFRESPGGPAPVSDAQLAGVPGCASLESYGGLARASDTWAGSDDAVLDLGTFWRDGTQVAAVAVRSFDSVDSARALVDDFAALASACAVPVDPAGGGAVATVEVAADGFVVGVAAAGDAAVGVVGPRGSQDVAVAILDAFAAQAPSEG